MSAQIKKAELIMRIANLEDTAQINHLLDSVYPELPNNIPNKTYINNLIKIFPEGQFVAELDGKIVGFCATIRVASEIALKPHNWREITGNFTANTHNPNGDYLYGLEFCVDPAFRHHHIGHRLLNERKELCINLRLKGIVAGGRMEKLSQEIKKVKTPEKYIEMVNSEQIFDPALIFQLHNGYEIIGVLKDYFPDDKESLGYATHLIWHNPEILDGSKQHKIHRKRHHYLDPDHVRVAAVQYKQRKIESFEEFATHVEYFVSSVADYNTDFVVFPESFTMQLLSMHENNLSAKKAIKKLTTYTEQYKEMMHKLALEYNINIIGGSIATQTKESIENVAYIFLRDGSIHTQGKIHPTPDERSVWGMKGACELNRIYTDCGPIGVLICYDSEFPELTRHLIDQGIYILFVPFCTDQRAGYLRVRYSAHARAVENQCYVVIAGNVGNLPDVKNMNIQYAQSCILTPSDFPFARDGIAADTTPNVEAIAIADLNLRTLIAARNTGSVTNLKDRRCDLYSVQWHKNEQKKI